MGGKQRCKMYNGTGGSNGRGGIAGVMVVCDESRSMKEETCPAKAMSRERYRKEGYMGSARRKGEGRG